MTQEIRTAARVRYPTSLSHSQRHRDYVTASQNLWAKALTVVGLGILLLLAYAIFRQVALVIIGVCIILIGLCLVAFDCMLKNKCRKSVERRRGVAGAGARSRHRSEGEGGAFTRDDLRVPPRVRTRTSTSPPSLYGNDIWASSLNLDWAIPPPSPPPMYSPNDPVAGLDIEADHTDDDDDSVADLPIFFPIRSRRRCISTPPLPSYEEVIELDRREGNLSSSLPSLHPETSTTTSISSSDTPSVSLTITPTLPSTTEPTTGVISTVSATISLTTNEIASPDSMQSRGRTASLPIMKNDQHLGRS